MEATIQGYIVYYRGHGQGKEMKQCAKRGLKLRAKAL